MIPNQIAIAFLIICPSMFFVGELGAQKIKNIVLVHGAWADGSSWSKVISKLEPKGFNVVAVQNPVTSFEDDLAATKRILDLQDGPVLLVGHSWAGVVITEAGNHPKVAGLVYIAAFAPGNGQSIDEVSKPFPATPGLKELIPDNAGFLRLSRKGVFESFAPDTTKQEKQIIFAVQGQTAASIFNAKIHTAAWKTKPSWYAVATKDRMIDPSLQEFFANNMKAQSIKINASHVPMISQASKVAAFIEKAANSL